MAGGVFNAPAPRIYSIASGRAFLGDLARELTASIKAAGFELPDAVVYLPTRRAARALAAAFLDASGATAALTPHIRALGDIDEDEFALGGEEAAASLEDELALAPPVASAERRLLLARLIAEKDKTYFDGQRHWAGAIAAADELGKLLDSLYTEEVDPQALQFLAPDHLARHWRDSLEFLDIVTRAWPAHLEAEGLSDPAAWRIALIEAQRRRWAAAPPQRPVIVAGTTGSTPAVARMMKLVSGLPHGCVVLPGLDLAASAHVWDAIDEPHPQSGLKALLDALEIGRENVLPWPGGEAPSPRAGLVTVALRPADASDDWRQWAEAAKAAGPEIKSALGGLSLIETRDEDEEASVIAVTFREAIETPGRTAMLVTPDRDLARRVSTKMRRWGVNVDDSAGAPFANTPCGVYLRLVAAWLGDPSDPVKLMAMIDHPRFGGGLGDAPRRNAVRKIDLGLRGLRPVVGPNGGLAGARAKVETEKKLTDDAAAVFDLLMRVAAGWPAPGASFSERFEAHLAAAEVLSAGADETGDKNLWRGDDGEAGAALIAQLRGGLSYIVHDAPGEYADIFARLIAVGAVRRRAPAHPRLSILGPLEARLQTADLVILAGLNEGVWPRDAAIDPFLSRPMRKDLGLPSPERRIGLAAHDFAQLVAAPEIVLTRAGRAAGKPTKPSRWIVRLKNILKGADLLKDIEETQTACALAARLDKPETIAPVSAPQPRPPVAARPKSLSVTQVERLLRDPYSIYAQKILRLRKLDPLGEDFGARHLGNLFHKVLEEYANEALPPSREARIARLAALYAAHAEAYGLDARHGAFWRARAHAAFEFLAEWDAARRQAGEPLIVEGKGQADIAIAGDAYTLTAKADRIDRLNDGSAFIVDYKTGSPPSLDQVKSQFSPQLPLTGVIVQAGGFEALGPAPVSGFEYVRVISRKPDEKFAGAAGADAAQHIAEARDGLAKLFAHFASADAAYPSQPRPQFMNDYGDYDHLARRRERSAQGEGEGGTGEGGGGE